MELRAIKLFLQGCSTTPFDGLFDRRGARLAARKSFDRSLGGMLEGPLDELYDTSLSTSSSILTTGERVQGESLDLLRYGSMRWNALSP